MALLLSRQVKTEVDEIWSYIAVESGSVDIADRVVDAITETFFRYPGIRILAVGATTFARACVAFPLEAMSSFIAWKDTTSEYSMWCTVAVT